VDELTGDKHKDKEKIIVSIPFPDDAYLFWALWCVDCHPKKEGASYIDGGDSLCVKHFEERIKE